MTGAPTSTAEFHTQPPEFGNTQVLATPDLAQRATQVK